MRLSACFLADLTRVKSARACLPMGPWPCGQRNRWTLHCKAHQPVSKRRVVEMTPSILFLSARADTLRLISRQFDLNFFK